jgi:nucleoside-diphosphate-sugar epimerase
MSKRVLITGATGFVGSHTADAYLAAGWTVRTLVRNPDKLGWLSGKTLEIAPGSLTDTESLAKASQQCDVVVHCAGLTKTPDAREFYRINADAVEAFTSIARESGVRRFVLCSTQAAAGPCPTNAAITELDLPKPVSEYGRSKLEGEARLRQSAGSMEWIILRPPAIMGPRDEQFIPLFRAIVRYGIYPRFGSGTQRYSLIGVHDFARALLVAGETATGLNDVYFSAGPDALNWGDAAAIIAGIAHRKVRPIPIPAPVLHSIGTFGEWFARLQHKAALINRDKVTEFLAGDWICSSEKIRQALGFECKQSLEDTLRVTYQSYLDAGRL